MRADTRLLKNQGCVHKDTPLNLQYRECIDKRKDGFNNVEIRILQDHGVLFNSYEKIGGVKANTDKVLGRDGV